MISQLIDPRIAGLHPLPTDWTSVTQPRLSSLVATGTGIRRLRLIDPGRVTAHSLSSHALATHEDLGCLKGEVLRRDLGRIIPTCHVEVVPCALNATNAVQLLQTNLSARAHAASSGGDGCAADITSSDTDAGSAGGRATAKGGDGGADGDVRPDMVLVCLPPARASAHSCAANSHTDLTGADSGSAELVSVTAAIAACLSAGVRCVPVLYADVERGGGREVAHQRFSSLHDICGSSQARALAAQLRHMLPVTPPTPMAAAALLAIHSAEGSDAMCSNRCARLASTGITSGFRPPHNAWLSSRAAGEVSTAVEVSARGALLAAMGHAAASICISMLAGVPLSPTSGLFSRANRDDAHRALIRRERDVFGSTAPLDVWPEDIEFLVTEVWGGQCVLTGTCHGGGGPALTLTRWDRQRVAAVDNLVLMVKERAAGHDNAAEPYVHLDPLLVCAVSRALAQARIAREAWRYRDVIG